MSLNNLPATSDPDLKVVSSNVTTPVQMDHECTTPLKFLDQAPINIEYTRHMITRKAKYYECVFTNNTESSNPKYFLFIAEDHLDTFKALDTANGKDGNVTFQVSTPEFMYGQKDTNGTNRFLVYHYSDMSYIIQHRFVTGAAVEYGTMASGFVNNYQQGDDIAKFQEFLAQRMNRGLRKFS